MPRAPRSARTARLPTLNTPGTRPHKGCLRAYFAVTSLMLTLSKKPHLAIVVGQAHNSDLEATPARTHGKAAGGVALTRRIAFTRRRSFARITSGRDGSCLTN